MSRNIKFRAWDKTNKEMFNVARYDFADNTVYRQLFGKGVLGEDCEILQYTGLLDKHGTELYEGDIVKGTAIKSQGAFDYFGVVEFETQNNVHGYHVREPFRNGSAGVWELRQLQTRISLDHITGEIIGDIYQHPELLEGVE